MGKTEVMRQHGFQSTPPARGATRNSVNGNLQLTFQSTPPARGATLPNVHKCRICSISIHAPREGGDASFGVCQSNIFHFNPRPPRGGRL